MKATSSNGPLENGRGFDTDEFRDLFGADKGVEIAFGELADFGPDTIELALCRVDLFVDCIECVSHGLPPIPHGSK